MTRFFLGKVFLSPQAIELGLVDNVLELETIAHDLIKAPRLKRPNKIKFMLSDYIQATVGEIVAQHFTGKLS